MIHFLYWPDERDPRLPPERLARQLAALADAGFATSPLLADVLSDHRALKGVPQGATVVYRGPVLPPANYRRLVQAITDVGAQPFTTADQYAAAALLSRWQPLLAEWTAATVQVPRWQALSSILAKLTWPAAQLWCDTGPVLGTRGWVRPADMADPAERKALEDDVRLSLDTATLAAGLYLREIANSPADRRVYYLVVRGTPYAREGTTLPECVLRAAERINNPFFVAEVVSPAGAAAPRIARIADGQTADIFGWSPEAIAQVWQNVRAKTTKHA